jgi:hypothetical protein
MARPAPRKRYSRSNAALEREIQAWARDPILDANSSELAPAAALTQFILAAIHDNASDPRIKEGFLEFQVTGDRIVLVNIGLRIAQEKNPLSVEALRNIINSENS